MDDRFVVGDDEARWQEGNDDTGRSHVIGRDEGRRIVEDVDVGTERTDGGMKVEKA